MRVRCTSEPFSRVTSALSLWVEKFCELSQCMDGPACGSACGTANTLCIMAGSRCSPFSSLHRELTTQVNVRTLQLEKGHLRHGYLIIKLSKQWRGVICGKSRQSVSAAPNTQAPAFWLNFSKAWFEHSVQHGKIQPKSILSIHIVWLGAHLLWDGWLALIVQDDQMVFLQ